MLHDKCNPLLWGCKALLYRCRPLLSIVRTMSSASKGAAYCMMNVSFFYGHVRLFSTDVFDLQIPTISLVEKKERKKITS